jgi:hypothetical protein
MQDTPKVESLQNKQYFEHNKSISAGYYYHQNNYCKQSTVPKIVKPVPVNQQNCRVPVKIGFNNFQ